MNAPIFQYKQNEVRVAKIDEDGVPWFVAKDVCDALGLTDVSKSLERLDDDEKGTNTIRTLGGPQEMAVISEPGLYALIGNSRKPEAKAFSRWVCHDVLPQIRKTGRYEIAKPATELDAIEANARAVVQMVGEIRESKRIATEALQKADENSQRIVVLSRELSASVEAQQALVERQQAVLSSIPTLPEPTEQVAPRTTRSHVAELLRWAAIHTGKPHRDITLKAHREFKYAYNVDALERARNLKKQPGNSKITGLHVVEQLGHIDHFYALCVKLFGRPTDPVPNVRATPDPI